MGHSIAGQSRGLRVKTSTNVLSLQGSCRALNERSPTNINFTPSAPPSIFVVEARGTRLRLLGSVKHSQLHSSPSRSQTSQQSRPCATMAGTADDGLNCICRRFRQLQRWQTPSPMLCGSSFQSRHLRSRPQAPLSGPLPSPSAGKAMVCNAVKLRSAQIIM